MTRRPLLCFLALVILQGGCKTTPERDSAKTAATAKKKPPLPSIPDQSQDQAFLAFIGRLRAAVGQRDYAVIADMMTADFGYRLDPPAEGKGVFAYWDANNVWPELALILNERFVPKENYMVAPKEFVTNESTFNGYRAGIQLVNGSWKFAYFVSG